MTDVPTNWQKTNIIDTNHQDELQNNLGNPKKLGKQLVNLLQELKNEEEKIVSSTDIPNTFNELNKVFPVACLLNDS